MGWKNKNERPNDFCTADKAEQGRGGLLSRSIAQEHINRCRATAIIAILRRLALPRETRVYICLAQG
jgi:hypothetical protein